MAVAGGGTATKDVRQTPKNASYYTGGQGVLSTGETWFQGTAYDGQTLGGGLLIVYANTLSMGETGRFASAGKPINGSCWAYKYQERWYRSGGAGGGSGGGSINIFYNDSIEGIDSSKFIVTESYSPSGTYNVGSIQTGTYQKTLSN